MVRETVHGVQLVTREQETENKVRLALQGTAIANMIGVYGTMSELKDQLATQTLMDSRVVIVDIDAEPHRMLSNVRRITAGNPERLCLVVSSKFSETLLLEAMQAGVRHFLRKSNLAAELDGVLERLLFSDTPGRNVAGDVISVLSCSGGCGTTTVAVNLANELRLVKERPVLLVDADCDYGAVSTYLGIEGNYGVGHVLSRKHTIDCHLIESCAVNYAENLDILVSSVAAQHDLNQRIDYEALPDALETCCEAYRYVIVDAPRLSDEALRQLATISTFVIPVFQLTIRDLGVARNMIATLDEHGIQRERILPVANRVGTRRGSIGLAESKRIIGVDSFHCIRSDWKQATRSLSKARPLAETARRSKLRKDFRQLAQRVTSK